MGANKSKKKEAEVFSEFTLQERKNIKKLYKHIIGNDEGMEESHIRKYYPEWLDDRIVFFLFAIIKKTNLIPDVSKILFARSLAEALRGSYADKRPYVTYLLVYGEDDYPVELNRLYRTVKSFVTSYISMTEKDINRTTWKSGCTDRDVERLSLHLLDLHEVPPPLIYGVYEEPDYNHENSRSSHEVEVWMSDCPLFMNIFDVIFNKLFPIAAKETFQEITKSLIPLAQTVDWSRTSTVLDYLSIIYINFHLPAPQKSQWRLLYSNSCHDNNFSQLMSCLNDGGANVLVVRDKDGYVFGSYVPQSWEVRPQFYGTSECFLFTIQPTYGLYRSTGNNNNFMYCNQEQEALPNGLGLGGELDYFGLWIDQSLNSGHSRVNPNCTTYCSPQLSGSPEFVVDTLEVWAVGPQIVADLDEYPILELEENKQQSEEMCWDISSCFYNVCTKD